MSIELVYDADIERRLIRLLADVRTLQLCLTRAKVRASYDKLEAARDALSRILDRADGKNA